MIYDLRIYDLKPGTVPQYMEAVRELALPIRQDYGVKLVGWYFTEIGPLNQVIHIWAFRDWNHMEEAKAAFRKDPRWTEQYLPRVQDLVVAQRNQIVRAADFSPEPAAVGSKQ